MSSIIHKRKPLSELTKEKIRKSLMGHVVLKETRDKSKV